MMMQAHINNVHFLISAKLPPRMTLTYQTDENSYTKVVLVLSYLHVLSHHFKEERKKL